MQQIQAGGLTATGHGKQQCASRHTRMQKTPPVCFAKVSCCRSLCRRNVFAAAPNVPSSDTKHKQTDCVSDAITCTNEQRSREASAKVAREAADGCGNRVLMMLAKSLKGLYRLEGGFGPHLRSDNSEVCGPTIGYNQDRVTDILREYFPSPMKRFRFRWQPEIYANISAAEWSHNNPANRDSMARLYKHDSFDQGSCV